MNASGKKGNFPHCGELTEKKRMIAALHAHGHIDPRALPLLLAALTLRRFKAMLDALEPPKKETRKKRRRRA